MTLLTTTMAVEHDAVEPPLEPAHVQTQGDDEDVPLNETDEAVPVEQRFAVGADEFVDISPLDDPQDPFTATAVV